MIISVLPLPSKTANALFSDLIRGVNDAEQFPEATHSIDKERKSTGWRGWHCADEAAVALLRDPLPKALHVNAALRSGHIGGWSCREEKETKEREEHVQDGEPGTPWNRLEKAVLS